MRAACAHQRGRGETYTTHPGAACQDCGYRLGSAWLTEPLPPDVEAFVLDLRRLPASRGAAGQAEAKASAERVTLRVVGRAMRNRVMPQAEGDHWLAEVLACLRSDAETLELGFDPDSRQAKRTYRAVVEQTAKLRACLGASYRALVEV